MSARDNILARIRARQGKSAEPSAAEREALEAHARGHPASARPRMAWEPVVRFREQALRLASTVEDVTSLDGVPAAAARYLRDQGLPLVAVCWPQFAGLPWQGAGIDVDGSPTERGMDSGSSWRRPLPFLFFFERRPSGD